MSGSGSTICRYLDRSWSPEQLAAIDHIFFSSSATKIFASPAERAAFRERWLGRYLRVDAAHAFIAIDGCDRVVGYLAGTLQDAAKQARFADLSSVRAFAESSRHFPAHLHINVVETMRGQAIGTRLIEAFGAHAIEHNVHGMHLVTSAGARNVRFYQRCGFTEVDRIGAGDSAVVFLGRSLTSVPGPSSVSG